MCTVNNIGSFGFTKNNVHIKGYIVIISLCCYGDICAKVDDFVTDAYDQKIYVGKAIEVDDTDVYV